MTAQISLMLSSYFNLLNSLDGAGIDSKVPHGHFFYIKDCRTFRGNRQERLNIGAAGKEQGCESVSLNDFKFKVIVATT